MNCLHSCRYFRCFVFRASRCHATSWAYTQLLGCSGTSAERRRIATGAKRRRRRAAAAVAEARGVPSERPFVAVAGSCRPCAPWAPERCKRVIESTSALVSRPPPPPLRAQHHQQPEAPEYIYDAKELQFSTRCPDGARHPRASPFSPSRRFFLLPLVFSCASSLPPQRVTQHPSSARAEARVLRTRQDVGRTW